MADLDEDFRLGGGYAFKAPLFLNSMLGLTLTPSTGFPSLSTTIPPTVQPASSAAVKCDGSASEFSEDQLAQYGP
jgi:hypothetical protein